MLFLIPLMACDEGEKSTDTAFDAMCMETCSERLTYTFSSELETYTASVVLSTYEGSEEITLAFEGIMVDTVVEPYTYIRGTSESITIEGEWGYPTDASGVEITIDGVLITATDENIDSYTACGHTCIDNSYTLDVSSLTSE